MSLQRQIKSQLILFVVFLVGFVATFLYLFQKNYYQFHKEIFRRSSQNLEVIDTISKIETFLYVHNKSLVRFINTGNGKWKANLDEAEVDIDRQFEILESYNKSSLKLWIPVEKYKVEKPISELKNQILEFHKGQTNDDHFQRLFYLVRYNIKDYFQSSKKLVDNFQMNTETGSGGPTSSAKEALKIQKTSLDQILSGIDMIVSVYNQMFWKYAQNQNTRYNKNTNYYFRALLVSSVLLLVYVIFIFIRVMRLFYRMQVREERLALLGAKDLITGLFNRESLLVMGAKEIERAKRRGLHLSFLIVRIDPLDEIQKDFGQVSCDRLLHQTAEVIRQSCRVYDGLFKYDHNTFLVLLPEVNDEVILGVVERISKRVHKKDFVLVKGDHKIIPEVLVGYAVYPNDAQDLQGLLDYGFSHLTAQLDRSHIVSQSASQAKDKVLSPEDRKALASKSALEAMFENDAVVVDEDDSNEDGLNEELSEDETGAIAQEEGLNESVTESVDVAVEEDVAIDEEALSSVQDDVQPETETLEETVQEESQPVLEQEEPQAMAQEMPEEVAQTESVEADQDTEVKDPEEAETHDDEAPVPTVADLTINEAKKDTEADPPAEVDIPDVVAALNQEGQLDQPIESPEDDGVITIDFDDDDEASLDDDLAGRFRRKQRRRKKT